MPSDLEAEVEALVQRLASDRASAVAGLRDVHERCARRVLGLSRRSPLVPDVRRLVEEGDVPSEHAREAAGHLAEAEARQWEIGTWSTGSGEGLASMYEVRTLQLARAWLLAACARSEPEAASRARALVLEVAADPNDIAAPHRHHVDALVRRLDAAR
jgi:hypothetical protein